MTNTPFRVMQSWCGERLSVICLCVALCLLAEARVCAQTEMRRLPPVASNAVFFEHPPLMYDDKELANVGFNHVNGQVIETLEAGDFVSPNLPGEHPLTEPWPNESVLEPLIRDHKENSFFQKSGLTMTWLDRGHPEGYGITEFDIFATFAVPLPSKDSPLLITPRFDVRFLNGPNAPDVPARLHEAYVDFTWYPRLNDRWMFILGVAPSVYSDFQQDDSDAFRITGKGLARYEWIPGQLELIMGVLYLNRDDVTVLAAGGLIWMPHADARYELLFPTPKLSRRIVVGSDYEDWLYFKGEFGGNTWSIERTTATNDRLTLRDYRLIIGLERKRDGGAGRILEVGYVFSRAAEYGSATPDIEPDNTILLRYGFFF
ncbi:MAG: hypothetical protein ACI9HK_004571 [Pirellulaceae bacterium]|jgi:hypothetical protein